MRCTAALLAVVLLAPARLLGQTIWLPATEGGSVALEYVRPHEPAAVRSWYGLPRPGPIHGAFFLSGTWPIGRVVRLVGELPVAIVQGKASPCTDGECWQSAHGEALGNISVGADVAVRRALHWRTEIRLPTQTDNGLWSRDYWGRFAAATGENAARGRDDAFTMGIATASTTLELRPTVGRRTTLRLRAGAAATHDRNAGEIFFYDEATREWVPSPADPWDFHALLAAQVWRRVGPALLDAGASAVNRPSFDGTRVTDVEWSAGAGVVLGRWTPLVQARIPRYRPESTPGGDRRTDWWNLSIGVQVQPR